MYKISRNRLHKNDTYIDIYDPVFETLQKIELHTPQSLI
jgi:hypothetical protein